MDKPGRTRGRGGRNFQTPREGTQCPPPNQIGHSFANNPPRMPVSNPQVHQRIDDSAHVRNTIGMIGNLKIARTVENK